MNYRRSIQYAGMLCMRLVIFLNASVVAAQADTGAFRANAEQGWITVSSYTVRDSSGKTNFELILQHNQGIEAWTVEQYIGDITVTDYLPGAEIKLDYFLLKDSHWVMRITPEGKVWLSLVDGSAPSGIPLVLPVKVRYDVVPAERIAG